MKRLVSALLILAFLSGYGIARGTVEPEIVTNTVYQEVPYETIREVTETVFVDRPVEVPIEVIREVPVKLRDFANIGELEAFLASDNTDSYVYLKADDSGVVALIGLCEDLAFQLQHRAEAAGYRMNVTKIKSPEIYHYYRLRVPANIEHALNMVAIGNEWLYIEPQDDRIWVAGELD